jgi:hypothetical protein
MLSSIQLKKMNYLIAFTLLTSVFLHVEAFALTKLVFVDDKRNEIEMNVDRKGNVHILTSPIAGDFYYKKSVGEFIFRLEGMDSFNRLALSKLKPYNASFKKVEAKDRRITDTAVWDIRSNGENCGVVKASSSMVKDVGLTIADMVSINNAFAYILGDDLTASPCLNFRVNKANAAQIGFPLYLSTNHGTTLLKEESLLEYGRRVIMPKGAAILTDKILQDVYLHQMPEAARDLYLSVSHGKSNNDRFRLRAVRKSLNMVRKGEWKPKKEEVIPTFSSKAGQSTPIE